MSDDTMSDGKAPSATYIDPHAHMVSRTTDDYQRMAAEGVVAVIEPAFWLGQARTNVGSFIDYFSTLVGWERFRAAQFGIRHYCAIGLNSKEANNGALAEEVIAILPRYLAKEGVVAVGEIGYDDQSDLEDRFLREQLELAKEFELLVMIHTPHRDKKRGTTRTMDVIEEHGIDPTRVAIGDAGPEWHTAAFQATSTAKAGQHGRQADGHASRHASELAAVAAERQRRPPVRRGTRARLWRPTRAVDFSRPQPPILLERGHEDHLRRCRRLLRQRRGLPRGQALSLACPRRRQPAHSNAVIAARLQCPGG